MQPNIGAQAQQARMEARQGPGRGQGWGAPCLFLELSIARLALPELLVLEPQVVLQVLLLLRQHVHLNPSHTREDRPARPPEPITREDGAAGPMDAALRDAVSSAVCPCRYSLSLLLQPAFFVTAYPCKVRP